MGCQTSAMKAKAQVRVHTPIDAPLLLGKEDSYIKSNFNSKSEQALTLKSSARSNASATSRSSGRSSRLGTLYTARTTAFSAADMGDLDVMVLSYACSNEKTNRALGPGCYEATWKVQVGQNSEPIVIQLSVDKSDFGIPSVRITSDGSCIFPEDASCKMAKIKGDFQKKWYFIGTTKGMHTANHFEMRTAPNKEWLPATMVCEIPATGYYEMEAEMADGEGGSKRVVFPAVARDDIRYASSHKVPSARERFLMLEVPAQDPAQAVLSVDDCELVTHYFARPSPNPGAASRSLHLQVSQDRSKVNANMGPSALTDFLRSEVRAVDDVWHYDAQDVLKRAWTIQVAHFAQHHVQLEQSQPEHAHFALLVDGEPLVEASLDDLDCDDDHWDCMFHLVGQRTIDFDVYEMGEDGSSLESVGRSAQKQSYFHECRVIVENVHNAKNVEFLVDGTNFKALPHLIATTDEALVCLTLEELQRSYGINVPYKVPRRSIVGMDDYDEASNSHTSRPLSSRNGGELNPCIWSCCM